MFPVSCRLGSASRLSGRGWRSRTPPHPPPGRGHRSLIGRRRFLYRDRQVFKKAAGRFGSVISEMYRSVGECAGASKPSSAAEGRSRRASVRVAPCCSRCSRSPSPAPRPALDACSVSATRPRDLRVLAPWG